MENPNNNNNDVLNANFHHHNQNHNQSSSDDISRFLRQILVHPTDSPSVMAQWDPHVRSPPFATSSAPEKEDSPGLLKPQTTAFCDGINSGGENNDTDEYDCESEEGLIDEPPPKPVLPRSSSKRTRAAEVHNLSEKRRRSRINEKMKALQNLIPNSNKSDKASVLDEAIEYLKQLQLQVQMLTMRNGLNMHPMSLPGVLQPIQLPLERMNFGEENTSPRINVTGTLPVNQEASTQDVYSLTNQRSALTDPSMAVMPNIINSGNSFGIESSIPARFDYQLHSSSEEICWEVDIPHQQLRTEVSQSAEVSLPFGAQASGTKDSCSIIGREQLTNRFSFTAQPNTSAHLTRIISGPSELNNDIKVKPPGI